MRSRLEFGAGVKSAVSWLSQWLGGALLIFDCWDCFFFGCLGDAQQFLLFEHFQIDHLPQHSDVDSPLLSFVCKWKCRNTCLLHRCHLLYLNSDKYIMFQWKDLHIRYLSESVNYIWEEFKLFDGLVNL